MRRLSRLFLIILAMSMASCLPTKTKVPSGFEKNAMLIQTLRDSGFQTANIQCSEPCVGFVNTDMKVDVIAYSDGSAGFDIPIDDTDKAARAFLLIKDVYGSDVFNWASGHIKDSMQGRQVTTLNGYYVSLDLKISDTDPNSGSLRFIVLPME